MHVGSFNLDTYQVYLYRRPTEVTGACSIENDALKTKSRTTYASFHSIAQIID